MDWDFALWCIWNDLLKLQAVEDALVQRPLGGAAVPELLVVVIEALPVVAELGQAVLVDVVDTVKNVSASGSPCSLVRRSIAALARQ